MNGTECFGQPTSLILSLAAARQLWRHAAQPCLLLLEWRHDIGGNGGRGGGGGDAALEVKTTRALSFAYESAPGDDGGSDVDLSTSGCRHRLNRKDDSKIRQTNFYP